MGGGHGQYSLNPNIFKGDDIDQEWAAGMINEDFFDDL